MVSPRGSCSNDIVEVGAFYAKQKFGVAKIMIVDLVDVNVGENTKAEKEEDEAVLRVEVGSCVSETSTKFRHGIKLGEDEATREADMMAAVHNFMLPMV